MKSKSLYKWFKFFDIFQDFRYHGRTIYNFKLRRLYVNDRMSATLGHYCPLIHVKCV